MHVDLGMLRMLHRAEVRIDEVRYFFANYVYYRKRKHSHGVAWKMAKNTL